MYVLLVLDSYLQPARVVPSLNPCSNSTNPPERGENFIIKLTRVRRGSWPAVCMVDSLPPLVRSLDSLPPKQKRACAAPLWRKVRERVSLEQDRKTSQRRHAQSTQFPQPLDNWIPSVFPPPPSSFIKGVEPHQCPPRSWPSVRLSSQELGYGENTPLSRNCQSSDVAHPALWSFDCRCELASPPQQICTPLLRILPLDCKIQKTNTLIR